jgi:DNA-binding CsgD family transcriptional regulator
VLRLSEPDLRAMLDLVGESNGHRELATFRTAVLIGLRRLVPCEIASYNELEPAAGRAISLLDPAEAMIADGEAILARYAHEHPLIVQHQRTRDGRAYKISDFMDRRALHATRLYQEAYRLMGVEYQMAFCLPSQPSITVGLALSRGARDFGERDRRVLNLVRPYLVQAYRNVDAYQRLRARLDALERGAAESPTGIVVLDRRGGVELMSQTARGQLSRRFVLAGSARAGLPVPLAEWVAGARVTQSNGVPAPACRPLVLDGDERLVARFLPARGPDERDVIVLDPASGTPSVAALRALGLTPRQAEVLRQVALGRTNEEIASALSLSRRTVQKHLEHVYARLGVTSRAAAAATAWAGAELVGAGPPEAGPPPHSS